MSALSPASRRTGLVPLSPVRWAVWAAAILVVAIVPLGYTDEYTLSIVVTALILVTLNSSWNFLLGMAGVWNFGQLAIYACGGYGAGLLMLEWHVPAWPALFAGGAIAAAVSMLLAFPTLRLYGIYTSLLTFSFAQVILFVILNDNSGTTGGPFGLEYVNGLFPSLSPLASIRAYYWTTLVVAVVAVAAIATVMRTRFGMALRAVRDSLPYGAARGVSALRYRVLAFGFSGFLAGIAGALYTDFNNTIQPSIMGLTPMSIYVTMLVVGGLGTVLGPVVGTAILVTLRTLLVDHPGIELTILGSALLVIVVFFPRGLVGEAVVLAHRFSAWLREEGRDVDEVGLGEQPGALEPTGEEQVGRRRAPEEHQAR
ncbi:MAG: branched-chain amino acid ABC transporter permease [Actinomycetota bacterium]|nr:branched-chain amino acid ABC transporter permease [Actinomycetota bacterium]